MEKVLILSLALFVGVQGGPRRSDYYFDSIEESSEEYFDFSVPRDAEDTLLLVNVLFRHGNRTADSKAELYPNDPYLNFEYFPYGLGQLTKAGKEREFSIGSALRKRYNHFLGDYYYPDIVDARSTDYNRTKMSLQLVLAGLFPTPNKDMISETLQYWQPVPYNYVPREKDFVLLGSLCPRYEELYNNHISSTRIQDYLKYYTKIFKYISKHSGLNVTKFQEIYNMYFGISTEEEYGLTLPSWLKAVWPLHVKKLTVREYALSMGTLEMRKMLAGYLLEKILHDAKKKLMDHAEHGRKMYLYSAHESNLAHLLIALDVFDDTIPNYGAYIIIELHRIEAVAGVKIFYENYNGGGPKQLKMPDCELFCPLHKFASLMDKYLPKRKDKLC